MSNPLESRSKIAKLVSLLCMHPGMSTEQLVVATGTSRNTVRGYRSRVRHGLRLTPRKPARYGPKPPVEGETAKQRYHRHMRNVPVFGKTMAVQRELLAQLETHAAHRKIKTAELVRRLLEAIVEDNIVDAVLDDGEKQ